MRVAVDAVEFAANITAVVGARVLSGEAVEGDQVGPFPVDVDIVGVVEHVGCQAAGRADIDLQADNAVVFQGAEEFKVEEALSNSESIEVASPQAEELMNAVKSFEFTGEVSANHQKVIVKLTHQKTGYDLNQYLVSKGIVVSHLATERKNLEAQFLEILSQSK